MKDKKKNIFQKAVDAISDRDEKEALKSAQKEAAQAKAKLESVKIEAERSAQAETAKAKAKLEEVKKEAQAAKTEAIKLRNEARRKEMKDKLAEAAAARASEKVVKHVWTNDDTYASLAFEHYGSIQEPYWRLIYEHNKDIIGDHPNNIRTGLEIEIPPLPKELEK